APNRASCVRQQLALWVRAKARKHHYQRGNGTAGRRGCTLGCMDAVYVDQGREVVPTEHARGPWDPNLQHGSAPAALLARAVEREIGDLDGQVVRLSVELMRPVPLAALTVKARTVRAGKKLRLV